MINVRGLSQDRVTRYGVRLGEGDEVGWWTHVQAQASVHAGRVGYSQRAEQHGGVQWQLVCCQAGVGGQAGIASASHTRDCA